MDDDFFTQFAFQPPNKKPRVASAGAASSRRLASVGSASGCALAEEADVNQEASVSVTIGTGFERPSAAVRLAEYALIRSYRTKVTASVDDFHAFLISLGHGAEACSDGHGAEACSDGDGPFWALMACLLSVQCRDSVALAATRALMRRVAGCGMTAATVAALPIATLEDLVCHCNLCEEWRSNHTAAGQRHAAGAIKGPYEPWPLRSDSPSR